MGGLSRRELLKRSAVAGGVIWAAPMLTSGKAWGLGGCCDCSGTLIYAKFAPGNSQTCQNQCLQPGAMARYDFTCLVAQGLISVCDDVSTNDDTASMAFRADVTPARFAIKSENDCFIARCEEGFGQVYHWSTSFNNESYTPADKFTDPAANDDVALFQTYTGGPGTPGATRCTGNLPGSQRPLGTRCGTSRGTGGTGCPCTTQITGVYLTTGGLPGQAKLNFIEMELCVRNTSKLNCTPLNCN
ncbi:MAG TPA: twin-arginine translocation signal domain-containing protein [Acidimicrobiales bacterium]|nr:twin-arginine translocation signal domain-containing protein [Acidimicrobiales bacterium]